MSNIIKLNDGTEISNTKYLDSGAQGYVYKCKYIDKTVALKECTTMKMSLYHILKEIGILAMVKNCPRLLQYMCISIDYNMTRIVMPYYDIDLHNYINKCTREIRYNHLQKLIHDVSTGLFYLKKNKIIHDDLRTTNVMVKLENGELAGFCIIDFGLSEISVQKYCGHTLDGLYCRNYYAPESQLQYMIDFNSDIWSFAVLIYQYIFDEEPFTDSYINYDLKKLYESGEKNPIDLPFLSTIKNKFMNSNNPLHDKLNKLIPMMFEIHPTNRITIEQLIEFMDIKLEARSRSFSPESHKPLLKKRKCIDHKISLNKYLEAVEFIIDFINDNKIDKSMIFRAIDLFNRIINVCYEPDNLSFMDMAKMSVNLSYCFIFNHFVDFDFDPKEAAFMFGLLEKINYEIYDPEIEHVVEISMMYFGCEKYLDYVIEFYTDLQLKEIHPLDLSNDRLCELVKEFTDW